MERREGKGRKGGGKLEERNRTKMEFSTRDLDLLKVNNSREAKGANEDWGKEAKEEEEEEDLSLLLIR